MSASRTGGYVVQTQTNSNDFTGQVGGTMWTGPMFVPFDNKKDWFKELNKDEILKKNGKEFVFLRGLERLAKERGIVGAYSRIVATPSPECPCAVVTFQYVFADGATYEGSADATIKNCDQGFRLYLTAMAESRAKARALRNAFGIAACSVEEIAPNAVDEDDDSILPANDQQKRLIEHLARKHKMDKKEALGLVGIEEKTIDDITKDEAKQVIKILNYKNPRRGRSKK